MKCLPQPWWVEVVPRASVDEQFLFGRTRPIPASAEGLEYWPSGWLGILSEADWTDADLKGLQVKPADEGFEVTRPLFRATLGPAWMATRRVCRVRETISSTGEIKREFLDEIALPHARLRVPAQR